MDIKICTGKSCREKFSHYMITRYKNDEALYNWNKDTVCSECFCLGNCEKGPSVSIDGEIYLHMNGSKLCQQILKLKK